MYLESLCTNSFQPHVLDCHCVCVPCWFVTFVSRCMFVFFSLFLSQHLWYHLFLPRHLSTCQFHFFLLSVHTLFSSSPHYTSCAAGAFSFTPSLVSVCTRQVRSSARPCATFASWEKKNFTPGALCLNMFDVQLCWIICSCYVGGK